MRKEKFYKSVQDGYFYNTSCTLSELKETVCYTMPIFGQLEVEIQESDTEKVIYFKDIDKADVVCVPEGVDMTIEEFESFCDMSTILLILTLKKEDNSIFLVQNGVQLVTPANKNLVLFLGSLIGKKILED